MIDFMMIAKALPYLGPIMQAVPEVEALVHGVIAGFETSDQETLKAMLVKIAAENDKDHVRLQQELTEAEKK